MDCFMSILGDWLVVLPNHEFTYNLTRHITSDDEDLFAES